MSKVLKVENGNYTVKVEAGGNIILDTARGTNTGNPALPAGTVIVRGSLEVEGSTTTVESNDTLLNDNIITLNNGETGAGISASKGYSSGLEVDRGSLAKGRFIWDDQIAWTLGGDSGTGTWKIEDSTSKLLPLKTKGIVSDGTLYISTGNQVISVTGTSDYETGVFTYTGSNIVDGGGGVVIDDDNVPNTKAVVDYVAFAIQNVVQPKIEENDTVVETHDFQTTGTPSRVDISIDNNVTTQFFADRVDFDGIRLIGTKITTNTSNADMTIEAPGGGAVIVNDTLQITETPGVDDPGVTDPTAPTEGIKLYSKTEAGGRTGLFFVNKSSRRSEIISNERSLAYSMIF